MVNDMYSLDGQWALVTGASRGIGKASALGLAKAGASIIVSARNEDLLNEVASEIKDTGVEAKVKVCDIGNPEAIRRLFAEIDEEVKTINIVVNNAGIIHRDPAEKFSEDNWDEVMAVNLKGMFISCQEAGKRMIRKGRGKIINIASVLSFTGGINTVAYSTSKGGVVQLTRALANEWASKGVNVNAVALGYFVTDFTEPLRTDKARYQAILDRIPAQRWGKPEDIEGSIVFLSSSASDYVHGHTLLVDGGWMAR